MHRNGRTGRAGSNGAALSLVSTEEYKLFEDIQTLLKQRIPITTVEGFEHRQGTMSPVDLSHKQPSRGQPRQRGGQSRTEPAVDPLTAGTNFRQEWQITTG